MKNILITGKPGIGKTTIIKKVISNINLKTGGFYTEEIRENRIRVGFKIKSIDGKERILAHKDYKSIYRVGKYGVNINSFESTGVKAIEKALEEAELIVVDELGKMELYSKKFQTSVIKALDSDKIVLGVIQQRENPFLDKIRKRNDVRFIFINEKNRDEVHLIILNLLKKSI